MLAPQSTAAQQFAATEKPRLIISEKVIADAMARQDPQPAAAKQRNPVKIGAAFGALAGAAAMGIWGAQVCQQFADWDWDDVDDDDSCLVPVLLMAALGAGGGAAVGAGIGALFEKQPRPFLVVQLPLSK